MPSIMTLQGPPTVSLLGTPRAQLLGVTDVIMQQAWFVVGGLFLGGFLASSAGTKTLKRVGFAGVRRRKRRR